MVDSQKPRGGVSVVFCTWSSSSGPSDMLAAPRGAPLSASVTKDAWTGQRPARPGRRGSRFLSHRPGHRRPRRSVLFRSLLESRARAAPLPACVCACLSVRLLEENRTVVSDLHYGRRTRVACLLCARRWCSEGKLLRNRGFQDDICDHLCVFCCF